MYGNIFSTEIIPDKYHKANPTCLKNAWTQVELHVLHVPLVIFGKSMFW